MTDPQLVTSIKRWAAELSHASRRTPGLLTLQAYTARSVYRRFASAAAASPSPAPAGSASPVHFGSWLFYNLSGDGTKPNRRDVFTFAPEALGEAFRHNSGRGPDIDVRLSLSRASSGAARAAPLPYVWVHSAPDGRRNGGGLLSGVPGSVLQIVPETLRNLLSPQASSSDRPSVFVSVLRWKGDPLLHAALEAAYQFSSNNSDGNMSTFTVRYATGNSGGKGGGGRGGGGGSRGGRGGGGRSGRPEWTCRSSVSQSSARAMRTVVLPPQGAAPSLPSHVLIPPSQRRCPGPPAHDSRTLISV